MSKSLVLVFVRILLDSAKTVHDFLVHLVYHIYDANLLKLGVVVSKGLINEFI